MTIADTSCVASCGADVYLEWRGPFCVRISDLGGDYLIGMFFFSAVLPHVSLFAPPSFKFLEGTEIIV